MKKIFTITFLLLAAIFSAHSLPGFEPQIKDIPGDYVYYRDYSFAQESYVGFVYYGNGTYGARYYAKADKKSKAEEREVVINFTIDEKADHMELTGEKVVCSYSQDDYLIVNYLHDLIYEFNSRRIKADPVDAKTVSYNEKDFLHSGKIVSENFVQFGGDVKVIYDYLVPLFNVKSISNYLNEAQFEIVTSGRIKKSQQNEYDLFKGIPNVKLEKSAFKPVKKAREVVISLDKCSTKIDDSWTKMSENVWVNGDYSFLSLLIAQAEDEDSLGYLLKFSICNIEDSFIDWKTLSVKKSDSEYEISGCVYDNSGAKPKRALIKVIQNKENKKEFFMLTSSTFEAAYEKAPSYFNKIIKNFSTY